MSAQPGVYRAAPLDRTARVTTRLTWALAGALGALGVWLAADGQVAGWVLLGAGALVLVLMTYTWRLQPLQYVVEDGTFAVLRRSAAPKRFAGEPAGARPGALGLRVMGDGGAYGYLGRFRADGRTVRAFVTDRSKVALLDVGGTALAVSPSDRDAFLAEVGLGA